VWTSAIVGAAVGGTLGYLVGRHHRRGTPASTSTQRRPDRRATLDQRDVRQLAATFRAPHPYAPTPRRPSTQVVECPDAYTAAGQF
jgi:hypothetical protein